ncbi:MAG: hypothetical protein JWM19_2765 [Actinomycetia bacterium]|nr:hypothetical protein [Actinomycetes bacterium]
MRMYVIYAVAVALIAVLALLLDRALKAIDRGRRRRVAAVRLAAAAGRAEQEQQRRKEEQQRRKEQEETGAALTNILPSIVKPEGGPRKVA